MDWADSYVKLLKAGSVVTFRPKGNSMSGRIESKQLVTVTPLALLDPIAVGDIVLCKVHGKQYLHLVSALEGTTGHLLRVQISNNKGYVNGWTRRDNIYGLLTGVTP